MPAVEFEKHPLIKNTKNSDLIQYLEEKNFEEIKKIGVLRGFGTDKQIRENIYCFLLNIKQEDKRLYEDASSSLN